MHLSHLQNTGAAQVGNKPNQLVRDRRQLRVYEREQVQLDPLEVGQDLAVWEGTIEPAPRGRADTSIVNLLEIEADLEAEGIEDASGRQGINEIEHPGEGIEVSIFFVIGRLNADGKLSQAGKVCDGERALLGALFAFGCELY